MGVAGLGVGCVGGRWWVGVGGGYGGPPLTGTSCPVLDVYNYCVVGKINACDTVPTCIHHL